MLSEDRQLKVLDLGLGVLMEPDESNSFATADGIAVGTVDYMSPEQACGRDVDGRSDLYSLGCSIYHLISGKLPFPGENPIDRMGKRITGRHVPLNEVRPDVPASLVRVLDKLLANKPQDRFQNALEAAEALRSVGKPKVRQPPDPAKPESVAEPVIVRISPIYPGWFRPLATIAETQPIGALTILLTAAALFFGIGFSLAWLIR